MRVTTSLFQRVHALRKQHQYSSVFTLPERMGRTALRTKAEAEGTSQAPSRALTLRAKDAPADKTTKRLRSVVTEEGPVTRKVSRGYFDNPSQDVASAAAEAPHTPEEPTERRTRRRTVRLARTDTVAASIPQQVAAVTTLPTGNGQRTFQEAPVAVWSTELMREAADKLAAADSCKSCNMHALVSVCPIRHLSAMPLSQLA